MNHNMQPFSRMPLGSMGMGLGGPPNAPPAEPISHPRPALTAGGNAKKKRRTNAKAPRSQPLPCPVTQDLHLPAENQPTYARPPQLSGFGDTVIASNPFDDMPSRSMQAAMMQSGPLHGHPHNQHMGVPRMRAMNPMSSMNEINPMMGHNMGPMNPMGGPMNPMDRISPMNMGTGPPPGAMNNPMSRMSPMNMGQPSAMGMMGNPMGSDKPMNNMGPNQPPGNPMNAMNNRASPMNMGPVNVGSSQPTGPMNMMNPMGRMNPMKGLGPNQPPGAMAMGNMGNHPNGPQMSNMGRQMGSPINNIPGGNQNYMDNGSVSMGGMENNLSNHPNGSMPIGSAERFGPNPPHSYPNEMGMPMHPRNMGRLVNDPMNAMNPMMHGGINMPGSNGVNNANMGGPPINSVMNDMSIAQRNQMGQIMGGPMGAGSGPGNMFGVGPTRHPINMGGGNMGPQGFQARPAMGPRIMGPSSEKVYPPDQQMIFNTQNRNAPPIYVCGSCHKEVNDNDQGIVCESGCNFWFHRSCVGLSEAAFHMLTQAPYAEWACDTCTKAKKIPPIKFTT